MPSPATSTACPACGERSDGGLGPGCTGRLLTLLDADTAPTRSAGLVTLLDELDTTFARQSVHGTHSGARSATRPLPANLYAAGVAERLRTGLRTWANVHGAGEVPERAAYAVLEAATATSSAAALRTAHQHATAAEDLPDAARATLDALAAELEQAIVRAEHLRAVSGALTSMATALATGPAGHAAYLAAHITRVRTHPAAASMLRDLAQLADAAERAIDTPPELIPLGECGGEQRVPGAGTSCGCACHTGSAYRAECTLDGGCGSHGCRNGTIPATRPCTRRLYAEPGQDMVVCRDCKTIVRVEARRDEVIAAQRHVQGRPPFLADVCRALGLPITASMIRNWAVPLANGRARLTASHTDHDGNRWFRLADVRDTWAAVQAAKAAAARIPTQTLPADQPELPEQLRREPRPDPAIGAAS